MSFWEYVSQHFHPSRPLPKFESGQLMFDKREGQYVQITRRQWMRLIYSSPKGWYYWGRAYQVVKGDLVTSNPPWTLCPEDSLTEVGSISDPRSSY